MRDFLSLIKKDLEVDIFELFDPVCRAGNGDYDVVILTTEVVKAIDLINNKRSENSLKPLHPVVIDLLEIGQLKLSSSHIRASFLEKNKGSYVKVKEKWNFLCERLAVSQEINEK